MKKPIAVQVTSREWRERTFQLSGAVDATLTYEVETVGRERMLVNGRIAADGAADVRVLQRRSLAFRIPTFGTPGLSAVLDIRDGEIFGAVALRLTLDGEVVFQDRAFARLDRQLRTRRLPLPSHAPPPEAKNLPLPGDLPLDAPD